MTTDAQTLIGIIEGIEIKDAAPDSGKEWRLFAFKIRSPAGTHRYSTFDTGWPTNLVGGKTYRFTFVEKQGDRGVLRDLTGATLVDPSEFGAQPATNGQAPPTDEAKREATTSAQPEYKSPSRSYDQNQDITRRSIERQIALKAATELFRETAVEVNPPQNPEERTAILLQCADDLFAWLREAPTDVHSSPVEPSSEAEAIVDSDGVVYGPTQAQASVDKVRGQEQPTESDGGPPLFPEGQASQSPEAKLRRFANAGVFRTALEQDFGLKTTANVNAALEKAGLGPLNQVGNFADAYATLAAHRGQP